TGTASSARSAASTTGWAKKSCNPRRTKRRLPRNGAKARRRKTEQTCKNRPVGFPTGRFLFAYFTAVKRLRLNARLEAFELCSEFCRELVPELLVELFDALGFLRPLGVVDFEDALQRLDREIVEAFEVDVL